LNQTARFLKHDGFSERIAQWSKEAINLEAFREMDHRKIAAFSTMIPMTKDL